MEKHKINIAIADDQLIMRKVVSDKLSFFEDLEIQFQASSGEEITEWLDVGNRPDLILMDVKMDNLDGIEATRYIKERYPLIKILMLSVFDDDHSVFEAIKAGSEGYLLKDIEASKLYEGIIETLNGGAAMTPSIAIKVLKYLKSQAQVEKESSEEFLLSNRETEVLELLSKGHTYKVIADQLFISPSTVRKHIEKIYFKLNVCSKIEAINIARHNRLI